MCVICLPFCATKAPLVMAVCGRRCLSFRLVMKFDSLIKIRIEKFHFSSMLPELMSKASSGLCIKKAIKAAAAAETWTGAGTENFSRIINFRLSKLLALKAFKSILSVSDHKLNFTSRCCLLDAETGKLTFY